ncbi:MAG: amidase [Alphaproteobacteria bacterium]|nr:amidase [Alphaproteobacteria bacterium]
MAKRAPSARKLRNPNELTATEAAAAIEAGTLKSEHLVAACLERIAARDVEVKAFVHIDEKLALWHARAADRLPRQGVLHGVPVAFKDVFDTADMPTRYNSAIYWDHRPVADSAAAALTRGAGGIVLGKTATTEFALAFPAGTRNPHNLRYSPGGSSSGSAASVADFMAPLAFGTQTGGSNIRPSSFCGIVGYKPSFNMISRSGLKILSESLDTVGVMGRSVADCLLLTHACADLPLVNVEKAPARAPRIGFCRTPRWSRAAPYLRKDLEAAAKRLARAGAKVSEVDLGPEFTELMDIHPEVMHWEGARNLFWERTRRRPLMSPMIKKRLDEGAAVTRKRYEHGQAVFRRGRALMAEIFSRYDILLTPPAAGEAPNDYLSMGDPSFNAMWTALGVPCVTLPVFRGPNRMPVGAQIVGAYMNDAATLVWSRWVQGKLG